MGELISIQEASKIIQISRVTLVKRLDMIDCPIIDGHFSKEKFDEIAYQQSAYVSLGDVLDEYFEDVKGRKINAVFKRKLTTYAFGFNFWNVDYIVNPITQTENRSHTTFYILKADIPIIKSHLREMVVFNGASYSEKFLFLTHETSLSKFKETTEYLIKFFNDCNENRFSALAEVANYFRYKLTKELPEYDDAELMKIIQNVDSDLTGPGKAALIDFYTYVKGRTDCKSNLIINYNRHKNESAKSNVHPYDLDTYFGIAYMIMNSDYWEENDMIQKAVNDETCAKVWLYHLMHFVCAWRSTDIRKKIPRIALEDDPDTVFKKVLNNEYSQEQYRKIAEIVGYQFRYDGPQKPKKTAMHESAPPLKLAIPESIKSIFGMLAMLCESHNRKNGIIGGLCEFRQFELKLGVRLFGEPYSDVLDGVVFSNRRANKNYMNMISEKAEKTGVDGYLLASYARSHTGGIEKIPEITSRYLKAKMDGYSPDEIVRCLLERGVCSFVPFMLCSALEKDTFANKRISEQTSDMQALTVSPLHIENIMRIDSELSELCKEKVQDIIKWANTDNVEAIARQITESIVNGICYGKTEGVYCLSKACYKGCVRSQREHCIGCGNEMYVKSVLIELSLEIMRQEELNNTATTDGERMKRAMILKNRLYPASQEILKTIKYIYGEDITEYIQILERSGTYAAIGNV